ncbi:MAG: tRNA threonylcarbamoyladenosine dehydratase [Candidatus Omnitrophica bacterium]|nr:tRNA threonylcarbamoyladenosine dehydratase [Candidatus Omnitrophota bacterium]
MERFLCTELLLGKEKLKKLRESTVTVIGLGAVGSYCVEGLARSGIGALRLVDFDDIKATNINRHLYAFTSTVGRKKTEIALERVRDINPECRVEALEIFAGEATLDRILDNNPDVVIDAIDSLNPKTQVLFTCYSRKIPLISCMGAAMRTDPFSMKTGDLFDIKGCPLASRIRKKLRKKGIEYGIFCVYSGQKQKASVSEKGMTLPEREYERGRKRRKLGSLSTVTGMFGLAVAHCAIDLLTGGSYPEPG